MRDTANTGIAMPLSRNKSLTQEAGSDKRSMYDGEEAETGTTCSAA